MSNKLDLRNLDKYEELNNSERMTRRNKGTGRKATNKSYQDYDSAIQTIKNARAAEKHNKR